jgi:hydrogenase maturation factor
MLISISPEQADDLLGRLQENYPQAKIIGRVVDRGAHSIVVNQ